MGNTDHHVKNSKELAKDLAQMKLEDDEKLVSFDVVSLFTKVPIPQAMDIVEKKLEDTKLAERTNLEVDDIIQLLKFLCSTTYLSFKGIIYEQKFGMAIGSPVSPILANLFMEDFEQRAIRTRCSKDIRSSFWKRYVDNALSTIKTGKTE